MKKIIMAIMVIAGVASADFIAGANIGYGKIDSDASLYGYSDSISSNYIAYELKAGYEFNKVRVLGLYGIDHYKKDMMAAGEGDAKYFGIEGDFLINVDSKSDLFVGAMLGKGKKDFILANVEFKDVGAKMGGVFKATDNVGIEAGFQYKARKYDTTFDINMDDRLFGAYIGLNFMI